MFKIKYKHFNVQKTDAYWRKAVPLFARNLHHIGLLRSMHSDRKVGTNSTHCARFAILGGTENGQTQLVSAYASRSSAAAASAACRRRAAKIFGTQLCALAASRKQRALVIEEL